MDPRKLSKIVTTLANTGAFLREKGFSKEGAECFFALSEGDESFGTGDYAFEIGLCYMEMKNTERAKYYFEIAIRENPEIYTLKVDKMHI